MPFQNPNIELQGVEFAKPMLSGAFRLLPLEKFKVLCQVALVCWCISNLGQANCDRGSSLKGSQDRGLSMTWCKLMIFWQSLVNSKQIRVETYNRIPQTSSHVDMVFCLERFSGKQKQPAQWLLLHLSHAHLHVRSSALLARLVLVKPWKPCYFWTVWSGCGSKPLGKPFLPAYGLVYVPRSLDVNKSFDPHPRLRTWHLGLTWYGLSKVVSCSLWLPSRPRVRPLLYHSAPPRPEAPENCTTPCVAVIVW